MNQRQNRLQRDGKWDRTVGVLGLLLLLGIVVALMAATERVWTNGVVRLSEDRAGASYVGLVCVAANVILAVVAELAAALTMRRSLTDDALTVGLPATKYAIVYVGVLVIAWISSDWVGRWPPLMYCVFVAPWAVYLFAAQRLTRNTDVR